MIGNPGYAPRYEEYETIYTPYEQGYYVSPEMAHMVKGWTTRSPLVRTVAAPLNVTAHLARAILPYAILGTTLFKTAQDYQKDMQEEYEKARQIVPYESMGPTAEPKRPVQRKPKVMTRRSLADKPTVTVDEMPDHTGVEVTEDKPRGRSRPPEVHIPKFDIDIPGGQRLYRPGQLLGKEMEEGANYINNRIRAVGYEKAMAEPAVMGARAYNVFTKQGLTDLIFDPSYEVPEAVKIVLSDGARKALANKKQMKAIHPPAGQYRWRDDEAQRRYKSRADKEYVEQFKKAEIEKLPKD